MAYLGNHSATDSRDRIFSVLGLITARDRNLIGVPEYSSSVEVQFARLVRSFWNEYGNLDIICFVHLFSRYTCSVDPGADKAVPCWAPDWRSIIDFASPVPLMVSQSASTHIGNFRPLKLDAMKATYDAPGQLRKKANVQFTDNLKELICDGIILDKIRGLGGLDERELRCQSFICARDGHEILQSEGCQNFGRRSEMLPTDWVEHIARSLILDRKDKYLCLYAPKLYVTEFVHLCHGCIADEPVDWTFATWFERNRQLKFGTQTLEAVIKSLPFNPLSSLPQLRRPSSYPIRSRGDSGSDKLDTFLSRFHDVVRKKARRLMITNEGIVGMAPCRAREGDVVAVLYGCNIPLVLRNIETPGDREAWQVIGEGYAHGFMKGEAADLIRGEKKSTHRVRLV